MKNWYKNQKGSMTAYAVITIFCFIFILTGLFLSSTSIRKGQLRTIMEIVKVYKRDTQRVEEIYANRQILDTSKYVQDNLVLFYDGLNNTGSGHSNKATTWKDLSTSNFDGTLMNFGDNSWTNNSLTFDGIDDWVKIAQMDYSNITVEVVMEYYNLDGDSEIDVVTNWQSGGYGIDIHDSTYRDRNTFAFLLSGKGYQYIQSDNPAKIGKKYILTGSYDGSIVKFWENGIKKESNLEGTIGNTQDNTVMVLGGNPKGENSDASFNGKIYAVRIYSKALTDEEVKQNYELDVQRYGVEDNLQ